MPSAATRVGAAHDTIDASLRSATVSDPNSVHVLAEHDLECFGACTNAEGTCCSALFPALVQCGVLAQSLSSYARSDGLVQDLRPTFLATHERRPSEIVPPNPRITAGVVSYEV
jgi:hypothetical protein